MSLVINTNLSSLMVQNYQTRNQQALTTNLQRLSSGYRINSAADDAAGLAVSESLNIQARGLAVADRNISNGISMLQVMEGGSTQIYALLGRMRELSVQSSNGSLTATDRSYLNTEFAQLRSEIDRVGSGTKYNGMMLLGQSVSVPNAILSIQVGEGTSSIDQFTQQMGNNMMSTTYFGIDTQDITTAANAQDAIELIDLGIQSGFGIRTVIGPLINVFESLRSNVQARRTNLLAAASRIRDLDIAEETASLARNQILAQAGVSVLAQANQAPQLALQLLR